MVRFEKKRESERAYVFGNEMRGEPGDVGRHFVHGKADGVHRAIHARRRAETLVLSTVDAVSRLVVLRH